MVKVVPAGAAVVEVKPLTVSPIAELLKTPSTLSVLLEIEEQFPTKLRKLVQERVPIVKYESMERRRYVGSRVD